MTEKQLNLLHWHSADAIDAVVALTHDVSNNTDIHCKLFDILRNLGKLRGVLNDIPKKQEVI